MQGIKALVFIMFIPLVLQACADFMLVAEDGARINGRTLEFALPLETKIEVYPKKFAFTSRPAAGKPFSWQGAYGALSLSLFNPSVSMGGFNEKGLVMHMLWFPDTEYPTTSPTKEHVIDFVDMGTYILTMCANVKEVQEKLEGMDFYIHPVKELNMVPPLHVIVHDTEDNSLVLEFIKGKLQFTPTPLPLLTNAPSIQWHLTNLRNYIRLQAQNSSSVTWKELKLKPTGQGTGLLGLPGDFTPPSRFVKLAFLLANVESAKESKQAVLQASQLINSMEIPRGVVHNSKGEIADYTQWATLFDLKNQSLFVRAYGNMQWEEYKVTKEMWEGKEVKKLGVITGGK